MNKSKIKSKIKSGFTYNNAFTSVHLTLDGQHTSGRHIIKQKPKFFNVSAHRIRTCCARN